MHALAREQPTMNLGELFKHPAGQALWRRYGLLEAGVEAMGLTTWPRRVMHDAYSAEEVVAALQARHRAGKSLGGRARRGCAPTPRDHASLQAAGCGARRRRSPATSRQALVDAQVAHAQGSLVRLRTSGAFGRDPVAGAQHQDSLASDQPVGNNSAAPEMWNVSSRRISSAARSSDNACSRE